MPDRFKKKDKYLHPNYPSYKNDSQIKNSSKSKKENSGEITETKDTDHDMPSKERKY